jgi:hypothetical protein
MIWMKPMPDLIAESILTGEADDDDAVAAEDMDQTDWNAVNEPAAAI